MSRLEELIQTLCPDGVEKLRLSKICEIRRGQRITKSELIPEGPFPVISGGINPMGFTTDFNRNENTITVALYGTAGFVNWQTKKFWANDVCYSIYPNKELLNKYLYYFLLSTQDIIYTLVIDAVPAHLPQSRLAALEILVPPLPVQEEIVRILDTFSGVVTELEAEHAARVRQYEHYRKSIFTNVNSQTDHPFSSHKSSSELSFEKIVTIGEVCRKISSGGTPNSSNESFYGGKIPWLRTQEVNYGDIFDTEIKITEQGLENSSANWIPENSVIVAMYGASAARVAINKIPLTTNQACCNLEVNDKIANYKYVYYWLASQYNELKSLSEGAQPNLNSQKIKKYPIPLPSLDIQNQIVSILDRFDTLVNDLRSGLPAEIALRRKQYEYYRDKLLAFQPLN